MDDKIIEKCPKCSSDINFIVGEKKNIICPNCGKRLRFNGKKISSISRNYILLTRGFLFLVSFIVSVPIFVLIVTYIFPNFWIKWYYSLGLLVLLIYLLMYLFRSYKLISFIISILCIGGIITTSYTNIYSLEDICEDYKYLLNGFYEKMPSVKSSEESTSSILKENIPMPLRSDINKAVFTSDNLVEDFALRSAKLYFENEQDEYRLNAKILKLIQVFSIYKQTKEKWKYSKYIPKASNILIPSESYRLMGGNDLNYSIFLASCIKSIGSTSRIVYTLSGGYGVEVSLSDFFEYKLIRKLIIEDLFVNDINGRKLEYSKSRDGALWLRLDFNTDFPGEDIGENNINDFLRIN